MSDGGETATCSIWERRFQVVSAVLSATVVAIGLLVLVEWTFDVPIFMPRFATMKAYTALLFVALGSGLWFSRSRAARAIFAKRVAGVFVAVAAAVTLAEYVFGFALGLDELLFRDTQSVFPGRMAPASGCIFFLLGAALCFQDGPRSLSRAAAMLAMVGTLIALFGHLYAVPLFYGIEFYTSLSQLASVTFLLAACALFTARPCEGITRLLTTRTSAGRLLRRLVPAIIATPILIDWIQLRGQSAGYYESHFGVALMTLSTVLVLSAVSSVIGASLDRSEVRRLEIDAARNRLFVDVQRARKQLEADVAAMTSLNRVASLSLPQAAPLQSVLAEIVSAAIAISGADFGNIQILDPKSQDLRLAAQHGFPSWWLESWNSVSRGRGTCGTALERGERVIVEDVEHSPIFADASVLDLHRRAGVRAVQSTPLFTRSGEPVGMFSTHYATPHRPDERALRFLDLLARQAADIIERARYDERVRESEQRFRALVEVSAQIVWSTDAAGTALKDSPSWRSFTGQTDEEMRSSALEALHPEDRAGVVEAWRDAIASKRPLETEYRIRHRGGEWRFMSVRAVPLRDANGNVSEWIGMSTDITARKRVEAGRERQLREIVENAPTGIALLDTNLRYVEASPRWLRDYGLGPDAIGQSYYALFPEVPEHWKEVHRRCLAGATEQSDAEQLVRSDGGVQWVRWKVCPWRDLEGAIAGVVLYAEDITEARQAEEAVRASQAKVRLAQRVARVGDFDLNLTTGVNTWTPELEQMYGLQVGTFGKTQLAWASLVHPDDRARAIQAVEEAIETGAPTEGEWRVRWPDGSTHWISGRFQVFRDEAGRPVHMTGVNIEITERKQAEEQRERMLAEIQDLTRNLELRVSERTQELAVARDKLDSLISLAADGIISIDHEQRIIIFNQAAEEMFGWTRDDVLGKPLDMLLPQHLGAVHHDHVVRFGEDPVKARRMSERAAVIGLRKDGNEFPVEASISKQQAEHGIQFTVIVRDITWRKRQEDERARAYAEREVLLREIHHRVKNNLQVISSLFYLQARRTEQEAVRKLLDESRGRLQSIALIHEKLYRSEQLASVDFGDYLCDLTANLKNAIFVQAPNVELRVVAKDIFLDIDHAIPCALLVNELVTNALKHAFPNDRPGEIRITVTRTDSELEIEVSDTGVGFPPNLDFRKVTTLGLQLVASLTKQLRGTVELVPGGPGTTFRVRAPFTRGS